MGQREMADAVRLGIAERKHVAVQAGTGTGKTLAYLVPAILSGVAPSWPPPPRPSRTSSPARTSPSSRRHLDHPFAWAVLKGRSNYLCMQRLAELVATGQGEGQLALDGVAERAPAEELLQLGHWAGTSAHRRPGRAGRGAVRPGVERGERERPRVPGRGPLPERRRSASRRRRATGRSRPTSWW